MERDIQQVLFSESEIKAGIDRLAEQVTEAFSGQPLTVVSVLKGSCIFAADLIRRMPIPLELAFVSAGSYGSSTRPGDLAIHFLPDEADIAGRNLLLVDDILDTGRTMSALKVELEGLGAASVSTCVFLDKPSRRELELEADFRVFQVDDLFVVGYGLDFAGRYRNLPFVGVLNPQAIEQVRAGEGQLK